MVEKPQTTESIPAAALTEISRAITIMEDMIDVCKTAFEGIAQLSDSEQQALIAMRVLAYLTERQNDVRSSGRKGITLLA